MVRGGQGKVVEFYLLISGRPDMILSVLTAIFQVDLDQMLPECLHSGFY